MASLPSVLITGASTGIGAVYADRFAKRGHDLVLVARNKARMEELAQRLRQENGVSVDLLVADLTDPKDLAVVEQRLRDDAQIEILVNNAGATVNGTFADQATDDIGKLVALNTTALVRLTSAIVPRLSRHGSGAIINIGSVVGLVPEFGMAVYGATKAFVLHLSQALNQHSGVYVQAVLPAATRTEIWDHAEIDVNTLPAIMEVADLVDAALIGFDRKEDVTIPALQDAEQWQAFEAARQAMIPGFAQSKPASRYQSAD